MTKRWFDALEKVFAAEIKGVLPFQSKAKVYDELEADGCVAPVTRTFGDRWPRVTVSGWALTERGRILYCESCVGTKTVED